MDWFRFIVATDNGDPMNKVAFPSHKREAFNGLVLVIIRSLPGDTDTITVKAKSARLKVVRVEI